MVIESSFHQFKLLCLTWPGVKPNSYIYGISRLIHALGNELCVLSQLLCMKNTLKLVKLLQLSWLFGYSILTQLYLAYVNILSNYIITYLVYYKKVDIR